jgi:hypothetical protein
MRAHTLTAATAKPFIAAGDAIFTAVSGATGARYSFRVTTRDGRDGRSEITFASLLTGPNNVTDYTYIGVVNLDAGTLHLTKKSRYTDDSAPVKALRLILARAWAGREPLPAGSTVQHEGRCGRCARTLTVPSSIDAGLGPDCAGILAAAA